MDSAFVMIRMNRSQRNELLSSKKENYPPHVKLIDGVFSIVSFLMEVLTTCVEASR